MEGGREGGREGLKEKDKEFTLQVSPMRLHPPTKYSTFRPFMTAFLTGTLKRRCLATWSIIFFRAFASLEASLSSGSYTHGWRERSLNREAVVSESGHMLSTTCTCGACTRTHTHTHTDKFHELL